MHHWLVNYPRDLGMISAASETEDPLLPGHAAPSYPGPLPAPLCDELTLHTEALLPSTSGHDCACTEETMLKMRGKVQKRATLCHLAPGQYLIKAPQFLVL